MKTWEILVVEQPDKSGFYYKIYQLNQRGDRASVLYETINRDEFFSYLLLNFKTP